MSLFGKLFGKDAPVTRQLAQPMDLRVGDMVTLDDSFALPPQLRGQQFRVEAVNTYEYEHSQEPEFVLKGNSGDAVYMGLEQDDETWLAFSIKLHRSQVEALFDLDAFAEIFEEPGKATLNTMPLTAATEPYAQWLADAYHQVAFAQFGYFHRQDYRHGKPSQFMENNPGDAFEAYELLDGDESRAIDIEVYQDGDTDVLLTLYRPLTDIREYWPGD
ncbi:hypothetical protein PY479_02450 [Shewanella sp. A32]|uniref:hypothetical protein n=1 Tax=Shewanella sp. A32 TaxID=3031327 RepID=UPI0023B8C464|nr:hypothetical protein [Shewanella sp. A32]MDF0533137.1 hypothetical protein [Shewanella sp. A32]